MAKFSPEAERLVQQGIEAARAGQNDSARKLLYEAVRLEPNYEQAWLWLSGVEATQSDKIAALKRVLQINPHNAAAKRGLERLEPSKLDLSAVVSSYAAPAPARVTKTEEPTLPPRASQPLSQPLPSMPAAQSQSALPQQPPSLQNQSLQHQSALPQQLSPLEISPPVSQPEPERSVGLDSLEGLRPAIKQAQKRRITFLPRPSEMIIMAFLFVGLVGAWFFIRSALNRASVTLDAANLQGRAPTSVPAVQSPQQQAPAQAEQPSVAQPTVAEDVAVTEAPVFSGSTFRSQSYSLSVGAATVDQDARTVTLNVSVINSLNQTLQVRSSDFILRNAINDSLVLDSGASTLFTEAASLPAQTTVQGTLVFSGDVFRSPFQLTWQPTNGNVSQSITVR